jgi:hypothetical protein
VHEREKKEAKEFVQSGIFHKARWLCADAETEVVILAKKKKNRMEDDALTQGSLS